VAALSASICSVTRIVPSSAAMPEPTRPETISPVSTGPSSRQIESATIVPTRSCALKRLKPVVVCSARTAPVKIAVISTIGSELTPRHLLIGRTVGGRTQRGLEEGEEPASLLEQLSRRASRSR
jgi:hypothetical protein